MEVGYDVNISKAPAVCCLEEGPAVLCLSEDRQKLILESNDAEEKGRRQVQIHSTTIRRIDQGRFKAAGSFSIVVEEDSGGCVYYDLVAANAIDREVMVTTILLVLDQEFEGTLEQPIPCSPSLDQTPNNFAEPSISASVSLEDFEGLEARSDHMETQAFIPYAPSASSIKPANSTLAPNTWCATDACSLALNDITDTCTGIFALKQSPCLAPEQVLVEEFITAALGAPDVFYNCISEGGYWEKEDSRDPTKSTRHRASRLNAQAARLRTLRNEMSFAAALKQSKSKMQAIRSVKSFDSTAIGKQRRAADEAANQIHSSPLMGSLVGRMALYDDNGGTKESGGCLYYDSDPEDYRTQTRKPRNVHAASESFEERSMFHGVDFQKVGFASRLSRKLDDETIRDISQVRRGHAQCLSRLTEYPILGHV